MAFSCIRPEGQKTAVARGLLASACLATVFLAAACCPKGTVPCTVTTVEVDEGGKLHITRKHTCTPPGQCPIDKMSNPQLAALLEDFGIKILDGESSLEPKDVAFKVRSNGCTARRLQQAVATARAYRLSSEGDVVREARLTAPLDVVSSTGTSWVLVPRGGPDFDPFVREATAILLDGASGNTEAEYSLDLVFDDAAERVAKDGLEANLMLFGTVAF